MARIRARSEDSASHRPTLPAPNQEETESTGERLLELLGIAHIKSTVAVPQNHWREPETGGGAVVDPVSFIAAAGRRRTPGIGGAGADPAEPPSCLSKYNKGSRLIYFKPLLMEQIYETGTPLHNI